MEIINIYSNMNKSCVCVYVYMLKFYRKMALTILTNFLSYRSGVREV